MNTPLRETGTPEQGEFADQCVVVTGAAGGIGTAVIRHVLASGGRVIALDADAEGLARLGRDAAHADAGVADRLFTAQVDVSQAQSVHTALTAGEAAVGAPDKLACVAGILQMGKVVDLDDDQWRRTFEVNTTGVFNVCRAVARRMIERQHADVSPARSRFAIVNVSSNAATAPRMAMGAYAASKAAVTQMTRCLGLELAEYGIRCNIVSPGSTDTEMQRAMWRQGSSPETVIEGSLSAYRLGIPLRKIATADEVAQSVCFLLSDRASHITLHDLRVDGGATLDQ